MLYQISNGAVAFGDDVILHSIDFEIRNTEKIAIVGRNGCGKTTLLKLISGEVEMEKLDSDESAFIAKAGNPEIGYLKQIAFDDPDVTLEQEVRKCFVKMDERKAELARAAAELEHDYSDEKVARYTAMEEAFKDDGGYYYEKEYEVMIRKFGFSDDERKKPIRDFSGGQQTKIAFIKLLLSKPDILLLDEPTNHLDVTTIEWLEGYLKSYPKAVVVVSHDRMFLDNVVDVVYEIEYGTARRYPGNYTNFIARKKENYDKQMKDHIAQQKEIERLQRMVTRFKGKPTKTSMAQSKQKAIDRMVIIEAPDKYDNKTFHANFQPEKETGNDVLYTSELAIGYDHPLSVVSLDLKRGEKLGILGGNGLGKSTFLKILSGQLEPTNGDISITAGQRLSFLQQDHFKYDEFTVLDTVIMGNKRLYDIMKEKEAIYMKEDFSDEDGIRASELEAEFADMDGWNAESDAATLLNGLGVSTDDHYTLMADLPGAVKVKVLLAQALFGNPDILLLDEPTNYLDAEHIEWLTRYLQNYENAFIVISHDAPFLNAVTNVIWHVDNLGLTRYTANYEKFEEMVAIKRRQLDAAYERQQAEIKKEQDFIARNKARVATRGMANSRMKKLAKMEVLTKRAEKPKPHFQFKEDRAPSRFVLVGTNLVLGYHDPLTKQVDLKIERGEKIAIRGTNGLGKSTLLKTLLGMIPPIAGTVERGEFVSVGYFEQESAKGNQNTALEELWQEYPGMANAEVRAALAACGLTNDHITTKMTALSGGEAAKVVVVDEPTNHLDVEAKEELKRALKDYKGTLILVSHEPDFYEDWIDEVWNIEGWSTKIV